MYFYELKLLSPLFYRTRQDSGAAGSNTTDPWIGDIALSYAINSSLGLFNFPFQYAKNKPHYEDIALLPFITSIATPSNEVKFTRVYDTATSFISQGYFNKVKFDKTGNAPFRNWLKRQGLFPGSVFNFCLASRNSWVPPDNFTIRLGNMRETLASCRKISDYNGEVSINLYTMRVILSANSVSNLPSFEKLVVDLSSAGLNEQSSLLYVMPQYIILRKADTKKWLSYLPGYS